MNTNRDPQTCSMSVEPKNSLWKTSLPAHRYCDSTSRVAALVGARHTSGQIKGILLSVATLCENISNEFQIYFETHFLLLETLLDRNKLNSSLSCQTQFAKRILDK